MNTREKILREALRLFSEKGYDAVSVRNIASAVGIKESSLYNHFTGKQDIFDSIISEYNAHGEAFFSKTGLLDAHMQFTVDERTVEMYKNMTPQQFEQFALSIFEFYFTDELNTQMRRMLTLEQYRNRTIAKMYRELSFDSGIEYQAELFKAFMEAGYFMKTDPYILALEFYAPIFLILCKYDNDRENQDEARELFRRHIAHFNQIYSIDK